MSDNATTNHDVLSLKVGRWILDTLVGLHGEADAIGFAQLISTPTGYGTPARKIADRACKRLTKNLIAAVKVADDNETSVEAGESADILPFVPNSETDEKELPF